MIKHNQIKTLICTSYFVIKHLKRLLKEKMNAKYHIDKKDKRKGYIIIDGIKKYEIIILYSPSRLALRGMGPNGKDIRNYSYGKLKSLFGVSFQNDTLLADTIYNNVDFYRNLSKKDIKKALLVSQSLFVDNLEQKDKTLLSAKGTNLSGGQRQRLLIARALASSPKILILDDSSSALDFKTDLALRNAINKNYLKTTKIIIASRISSIMNADKIIVLENGAITGLGKHEELLISNQMYKDIYNIQLGGDSHE